MIFVVGGGGGGLSTDDALLHINAPLGSTITLKKDNVTIATLDATKGYKNSDGETLDWYYSIKSSNYGTWTVVASKSTYSITKTVNITTNKWYDLIIEYALYLINNGDILVASTTYNCTATEDATNHVVDCSATYQGYPKFWIQLTSSVLNGTYSSLIADVTYSGSKFYVGLESSKDSNYTGCNLVQSASSGAISALTTLTVNISSVTLLNTYVKIGTHGANATAGSFKIKNLYLMR